MSKEQKFTSELTFEKKEEIYNFCDEIVDGIDYMEPWSYYNDANNLHLKFTISGTSVDKKAIVSYNNKEDYILVDMNIKRLEKDFQIFLLMWGFCFKYCDHSSSGRYTECDLLTWGMFKEFAGNKYNFKIAVNGVIKILGGEMTKNRIDRIADFIKNFKG